MDRNNMSNDIRSTEEPSGSQCYNSGEAGKEPNLWGMETGSDSDSVLGLYSVVCVCGIAGNLLVCLVLLRVPSLRSNTSDLLVHLSLVDLAVCVLVIPYKIVPNLGNLSPPNPDFWGQLRCGLYEGHFIFWLFAITSIFSLVIVNLERFVAVVYPHKYKRVFASRRNKFCLMGSCWVLAAMTKCFILFLYGKPDAEIGCRFLGWPSRGVRVALGLCDFTLNLFAPFILMVSMQWKVISTLRSQVHALTSRTAALDLNPTDRRKVWQLRATNTVVMTLLAFVLTFAVCWAPNQFMFLLCNFGVPLSFGSFVYRFGVLLAVCNSCVNPIIYFMTNQTFRKGIKQAFRKGRHSARVGNGTVEAARTASVKTGESCHPMTEVTTPNN